jgi:hypothetical protein
VTALWQRRDTDVAYRLPVPADYGWAFARAVDPGAASLVSAVLLRGGLVYLMRSSTVYVGRYELDGATQGSATGAASSVANRAAGVPLAVFLSEMNCRWRAWASTRIADLTNAGGPAYGGPVWNDAGEELASLEAAATAWAWEAI